MCILNELKEILDGLGIPNETGRMSSAAPDTYCVLVPESEDSLWADDVIDTDVEECMISLFAKGNYVNVKNRIIQKLVADGYTVTDRRYIEYEDDTGYFHYCITVEHPYPYILSEEKRERKRKPS